ncbi:MAG: alpha/beta hydrolase [Flammeovirgaceae bacterium]|nr:alpha/beta hydrolase [Flammeovirgaceae bacterium]
MSQVDIEHLIITAKDGKQLSGIASTIPDPLGLVCLVHGFGEHIGRYSHVMSTLNESGFNAYGMDLRGHGKSEGLKGHAPSLLCLLDDIEEFLKMVRSEQLYLPLFLFGHSMGGNLVLNFILRDRSKELTGFIASSPWLKLAFKPPIWKEKLGRAMANILPKFRQPNGLKSMHLSKDPEVSRNYDLDPLVNFKISARLFVAITEGAEYVMEKSTTIKTPGYVLHGQSDALIDHSATIQLAQSNTEFLTFKLWEGVYHEPHNDLEQSQVIHAWIDWMKALLK